MLNMGGTGFFYDDAPPLPYEIEHIMPDYNLYNSYVLNQLNNEEKNITKKDLRFYTDYSIGFTTRGCFRKCWYCVNRKCNKSVKHSKLNEFLDKDRPYILLLDDNMLACKDWEKILISLQNSNKRFQYKQGLDERLLTQEKTELLFSSKYHEDYIFAFDNIDDKIIIEDKLKLIRSIYKNKGQNIKFYVFCAGKNPKKKYENFWIEDIIDTFERIKILSTYNCFPYIMRFIDWKISPYDGMYSTIAAWCNQPSIFKKMSFRQFSIERGMTYKVYKQYKSNYQKYLDDGYKKGATWRYMEEFEKEHPDIAEKYFDMKYEELNKF